nr:lipocalin-like domain-containing protein [Oceaniglobus ichthyenteri]
MVAVCAIMFWLCLALPGLAQGFAGLGAAEDGYAEVRPGAFDFPADHGAHPDFRIEWWYITANLETADGAPLGVQWTLFRSARTAGTGTQTGWNSRQAWMGHAAVTTSDQHFVTERIARGGTGQAGVSLDDGFAAWIDEWGMVGPTFDDVRLSAQGHDFSYDLELSAQGPIVAQGDGGYSVKSASGQASRYYSQPFYGVEGMVTLPSGSVAVTGQAWLDREWSTQLLDADQSGWDWVSLSFDTGEKLMGFLLRDQGDGFTSATWIAADGTPTPYGDGALRLTPLEWHRVAGRDVPVVWRVNLPDRGLDVTIAALNRDAWMETSVPYWEGPVTIAGSHAGRGYLEMTGYE